MVVLMVVLQTKDSIRRDQVLTALYKLVFIDIPVKFVLTRAVKSLRIGVDSIIDATGFIYLKTQLIMIKYLKKSTTSYGVI